MLHICLIRRVVFPNVLNPVSKSFCFRYISATKCNYKRIMPSPDPKAHSTRASTFVMNYLEVVKSVAKTPWSFGNCSYANDFHLHTLLPLRHMCKLTYFTLMSLRCWVRKFCLLPYVEMVFSAQSFYAGGSLRFPKNSVERWPVKGLLWVKCNEQTTKHNFLGVILGICGNAWEKRWEALLQSSQNILCYNKLLVASC